MKIDQRKLTLFSLIAVVLGAVAVNEFVLKDNSTQDRGLASFGERNEPGQIKWEHELANDVSQDLQGTAHLSKKPSSVDRLMFEMLQGKYEAQLHEGVITKLQVQNSQTPVEISTDRFLKSYGSILRSYDTYIVSNMDQNHELVLLKNKTGKDMGSFLIERDSEGRVVSIDIK